MSVWEIPDFVKGKKQSRYSHATGRPERVTVVTPNEIDRFLGARSGRELAEHLRWLRGRGTLITERGRLTQRVRCDDGIARRRFVFRGETHAVPKIRIRKRSSVREW